MKTRIYAAPAVKGLMTSVASSNHLLITENYGYSTRKIEIFLVIQDGI